MTEPAASSATPAPKNKAKAPPAAKRSLITLENQPVDVTLSDEVRNLYAFNMLRFVRDSKACPSFLDQEEILEATKRDSLAARMELENLYHDRDGLLKRYRQLTGKKKTPQTPKSSVLEQTRKKVKLGVPVYIPLEKAVHVDGPVTTVAEEKEKNGGVAPATAGEKSFVKRTPKFPIDASQNVEVSKRPTEEEFNARFKLEDRKLPAQLKVAIATMTRQMEAEGWKHTKIKQMAATLGKEEKEVFSNYCRRVITNFHESLLLLKSAADDVKLPTINNLYDLLFCTLTKPMLKVQHKESPIYNKNNNNSSKSLIRCMVSGGTAGVAITEVTVFDREKKKRDTNVFILNVRYRRFLDSWFQFCSGITCFCRNTQRLIRDVIIESRRKKLTTEEAENIRVTKQMTQEELAELLRVDEMEDQELTLNTSQMRSAVTRNNNILRKHLACVIEMLEHLRKGIVFKEKAPDASNDDDIEFSEEFV